MRKFVVIMVFMLTVMLSTAAHAQTLNLQYDDQVYTYTGAQYRLVVNGNELAPPLPPIIFNDRALVPIREVFEALGANVEYDSATKGITVTSNDVTVKLAINSNDAYVNGTKVSIPDGVVPKLIGRVGESAKTMVPVRFISESIGLNVDFDEGSGTISVSTPAASVVTPSDINMTGIEFIEKDWGLVITVSCDGNITNYTDFVMTDPYRIVLDLGNTNIATSKTTFAVGKRYVDKIRLGQHDSTARIVVDMKAERSYNITTDGAYLWINITSDSEPEVQNPVSTPATTPTADSKIVVIDAGHGGSDSGTHGTASDGTVYYEKDIALKIAQYTRDILVQNGVQVVMTRDSDVYPSLTDRSSLANSKNAALYVSIHLNSTDSSASASGTEVLYTASNNGKSYGISSSELANKVYNNLMAQIGTKERGVKTQNLSVCRNSKMPACLVEVGFMTNTAEMDKLANADFQYKAASGIAKGILESLPSVTVPGSSGGIEYMSD